MTTGGDELVQGEAILADGNPRAALAHIRAHLGWPRGKELGELVGWLRLLGDVAGKLGATGLEDIAKAAVRDPDSPDRLYDLGYALIDAGAPSIAASVLWHCLKLVGDSEEVVCELVSALESALAYNDAFAILEQHAALRTRSFLCEYLYAFNAAMTGRLETTRSVLARLVPDSPETEQMKTTITGIVERADRIASTTTFDERDLRGWQYALTGTLITHLSPFGFDEPMHGRYAWLQDTFSRVVTGIERLAPLVRALEVACVYPAPGRDHEILAHAIAQRFELPIAPWPAIGTPAPGLIVAYDLGTLERGELARLQQRKEHQILFAHASPWTRDMPVAPDVTTLLYQALVPPWGEAAIIDPDTKQATVTPPDSRPAPQIAADLLASPGLDVDDRACDEPAKWAALVEKTWPPAPGVRARWWAGGPVASNRFD
ncbi:MAG TPA: hypothetical protein VL326_08145 [Kofleriaceae bacterium]|jgi:hypothetical protein|nr:hypothetical protein [Kofleriaceae bacterium]